MCVPACSNFRHFFCVLHTFTTTTTNHFFFSAKHQQSKRARDMLVECARPFCAHMPVLCCVVFRVPVHSSSSTTINYHKNLIYYRSQSLAVPDKPPRQQQRLRRPGVVRTRSACVRELTSGRNEHVLRECKNTRRNRFIKQNNVYERENMSRGCVKCGGKRRLLLAWGMAFGN